MISGPENFTPDYLIMGHISHDLIKGGSRPGGTALYGGILAQRLGLKVGLITSCKELPAIDELIELEIINFPADSNTIFNNIYTSKGREQYLKGRANDLHFSQIPGHWLKAKIIHLGPITGEIDLPPDFPLSRDTSLSYSLQGWMRNWDQDGRVFPVSLGTKVFPTNKGTAAFLSLEDLGFDQSLVNDIRPRFPVLVLTKGQDGAEIFQGGNCIQIPPEPVEELDPTGAGDIFAAGFMIYWVLRGKSVREAGLLASRLAAVSVTRAGLNGIPDIAEIQEIEQN